MDMNAPYCDVHDSHPEIILASEKIGHFLFIRNLARQYGASFVCTKGEPAVISMEYFSDNLHEKCNGKPLTVFCISDVDPAGYSIERNFVKRLELNGHKIKRLVKTFDANIFEVKIYVLRIRWFLNKRRYYQTCCQRTWARLQSFRLV